MSKEKSGSPFTPADQSQNPLLKYVPEQESTPELLEREVVQRSSSKNYITPNPMHVVNTSDNTEHNISIEIEAYIAEIRDTSDLNIVPGVSIPAIQEYQKQHVKAGGALCSLEEAVYNVLRLPQEQQEFLATGTHYEEVVKEVAITQPINGRHSMHEVYLNDASLLENGQQPQGGFFSASVIRAKEFFRRNVQPYCCSCFPQQVQQGRELDGL